MKTAVLIDFDETIFRTGDFWVGCKKFWAENHSAETTKKIEKQLENLEKRNAIFAPKQIMTDQEWKTASHYCDAHAPQFLHEDFAEFLKELDKEKFTPIVFSFGEQEFQTAKLDPLNLGLPAIFLKHHDKTKEIAKFWRSDFYEILGEKFSEIILIDDRGHSFSGFEKLKRARGFLLNRGIHAGKSDLKNLAKNVSVVESFREIVI